MNDQILNAIDQEIAKLREARALLAEGTTATAKSRRTLSPKARRAIADAQHKRWAKVKRQKKTSGR